MIAITPEKIDELLALCEAANREKADNLYYGGPSTGTPKADALAEAARTALPEALRRVRELEAEVARLKTPLVGDAKFYSSGAKYFDNQSIATMQSLSCGSDNEHFRWASRVADYYIEARNMFRRALTFLEGKE